MLPVLVINRAADRDRLERFQASAQAHGIAPLRIAAQDGHRPDFPFALYAGLIGDRFWGAAEAKPGALGCYLSHLSAWRWLLDSGHDSALICEDDAVFHEGTGRLAEIAAELGEIDLIFANDRLADWAAVASPSTVTTLRKVIPDIAERGGPGKIPDLRPAPGADCYLITRRGAQRMIAATERDGIACGVDWALVWQGLPGVGLDETAAFPELATLAEHVAAPSPPLSAHVLTTAVAGQAGEGASTIRHRVTRAIPDLVTRRADLAETDHVASLTVSGARLHFAGQNGPDPVMAAHREGQLWDEPGIAALLARFPEGGTFVDIGAHIANHAVAVGRLGAAGRLILAEANDQVLALLRLNLALNGLDRIAEIPHPGAGIWSAPGTGVLLRHRRRASESMVKAEADPGQQSDVVPVALMTGDDLLGGTPVDAIKIDTGGAEPEILRGLGATLAASRPLLLIDHGPGAAARIGRLADEHGYRLAETVPAGRKNRVSSLLVPRPDGGR